jgi:hypothetical protein
MDFSTQGRVMISNLTDSFLKPLRWPILLLVGKLLCTLLAVFVFARFSPLIDAELYLSGFYISEISFRTKVIQSLVTLLSNIGGGLFVHYAFGLVSLVGVMYYYLRGGKRWQLCLLLLLPSTLIWTSVIGKETLFYGAFTLSLVIWARFVVRKCDVADYFLLGICAVVIAIFRPHYGMVIIWLYISAALLEMMKERALPWLCLLAFSSCALMFIFFWQELLLRGFGGIEATASASRFVLFGIDPNTSAGFNAYKSLVPFGAVLGILGPMPSELFARPEFIPFFLEGILILSFPVAVYVYACKQSFAGKQRFMTIFWICLVPAILLLVIIHAPFGLLNPGSAIRWRVNFEAIFHMAPLLLLFASLDNNENHSLPY